MAGGMLICIFGIVYQMKSQRVIIHNNRNEKMIGYLYNGTSKTLIIVCYGIGGSTTPDPYLQKILPEYLSDISSKTGASVFGFDFSGEGESEGERFLSLRQRDRDIKTVLDYFSPHYQKIIMYGYSLGGLSAAIASLHNEKIVGLITVNGFFTFNPRHIFPKNVLLVLSYVIAKPRFASELYFRKRELHIGKISVPTLVIYADKDNFVNPKQSISFFNLLRSKKKLYSMGEEDHWLKKEYKQIPPQIAQWMREEGLQ